MYKHTESNTIFYSFDQLRLWAVQNKSTGISETQDNLEDILAELGVVLYTPEPYVKTAEEIQAEINFKKESLWQAATAYQEKFISGAALSLLTIGVLQQKPKALTVMNWIQSIWNNHYYPQKELVDENYTGYDFSVCGDMPFTVPELSQEVLG